MREGTDSEAFSRGHGSSSKSWGERKVYLSINIILPSLSSVGENSMTNISKPKSETEKFCSKTGQSFLPREAGMERWKQIQTVHLNLALCAHSCMKAFTSIAQFANVSMQTICSLRELLRLIWSVHLFCCYKASYIRNQHTSSVCWESHGESRACNVLRFPLKAFSNTHLISLIVWRAHLHYFRRFHTSSDSQATRAVSRSLLTFVMGGIAVSAELGYEKDGQTSYPGVLIASRRWSINSLDWAILKIELFAVSDSSQLSSMLYCLAACSISSEEATPSQRISLPCMKRSCSVLWRDAVYTTCWEPGTS